MTPRAQLDWGCPEVDDRLEAWLDGELEEQERVAVERHLFGSFADDGSTTAGIGEDGCASCRLELARARRLHSELAGLADATCPQPVVESVLEAARSGRLGDRPEVSRLREPRVALRLVALAAAATVLAVLGVRSLDRVGPPAPPVAQEEQVSAEELARAEEQVRVALAYVAAIGRRSGLALRDDVLVGDVLEPSARALQRALVAVARPEGGGAAGESSMPRRPR